MSVIVLIGAPGSGKSTVGPLLAERLEEEFVDVDALIEQVEGRDIPEIFLVEGEPYFRQVGDPRCDRTRRGGFPRWGSAGRHRGR